MLLVFTQQTGKRFHSISFPNEWGAQIFRGNIFQLCLLSFPFNQFPQRVGSEGVLRYYSDLSEFPFNQFPQRVGEISRGKQSSGTNNVSIQLVSPTSGEYNSLVISPYPAIEFVMFPFNQFPQRVGRIWCCSGIKRFSTNRFHSISFPNEWGVDLESLIDTTQKVKFPFNQFPQRVGRSNEEDEEVQDLDVTLCFHSISFPNEWGVFKIEPFHQSILPTEPEFPFNQFPQRVGSLTAMPNCTTLTKSSSVSIQLVSPTSGEIITQRSKPPNIVSIQLVSPTSGEWTG